MLLTKSQLSKASDKELQQAAAAVKAELVRRESSNKAELLKKVKKLAAEAGVSISDLLGGKPARGSAKAPRAPKKAGAAGKPRGKVPAKYRNPANAAQTWTGRGRQPLWVAEAVGAGKSLDALLIK
jgi:DNA-binding protein H-NS